MASKSRDLLERLKERFILGEISKEDYDHLRADLEAKIAAEEGSLDTSSPGVPSPGETGSPDRPRSGAGSSSPRIRPAPFGDHSIDYSSSSPGVPSPGKTPSSTGSSAPFGVQSAEMSLAPGMEIGAEVPGKDIQRYLIGDLLGKGGWGAVFRAEDRQYSPARPVALKAIFTTATADQVALKRIEREARLGTELSHPNVVRIWDFSIYQGVYYLIMELVAGGDLNSLRAQQPNERFTLDSALPLLNDIAEGLDYLHSKGIIHRDLKPSNLLWHPDEKRLKISDFGLAKTARDSILLSGAKMPSISGTDPYMAPEIWDADDPSEAGDIYALGIIAYEMLKGDPPFRGPNFPDQHRNAKVKPLPDMPDLVNEALEKVLAKQSTSRFASSRDFVLALQKPSFPKCPICGEAKDVERFTCQECGKENLCINHKEIDGLCPECRQKAVIALKEERNQKEEAEKARRKEEADRRKKQEEEAKKQAEEQEKLLPANKQRKAKRKNMHPIILSFMLIVVIFLLVYQVSSFNIILFLLTGSGFPKAEISKNQRVFHEINWHSNGNYSLDPYSIPAGQFPQEPGIRYAVEWDASGVHPGDTISVYYLFDTPEHFHITGPELGLLYLEPELPQGFTVIDTVSSEGLYSHGETIYRGINGIRYDIKVEQSVLIDHYQVPYTISYQICRDIDPELCYLPNGCDGTTTINIVSHDSSITYYTHLIVENLNLIRSSSSPRHLTATGNEDFMQWDANSFQQAIHDASEQNKRLLVFYYADWTDLCVDIDRNAFMNQNVIEALNDFIPVKLDFTQNDENLHEIRREYNVGGLPTLMILSPTGQEISRFRGTVTTENILNWLNQYNS